MLPSSRFAFKPPPSMPCALACPQGLDEGTIQPYELEHPEQLMVEGKNTCRDVVYKYLVDPGET